MLRTSWSSGETATQAQVGLTMVIIGVGLAFWFFPFDLEKLRSGIHAMVPDGEAEIIYPALCLLVWVGMVRIFYRPGELEIVKTMNS